MPLNVPNLLTLAPDPADPGIPGGLLLSDTWLTGPEKNLTATALFAVAAATDWLDGYLARTLDQTLGLRGLSRSRSRQADGGGGPHPAGPAAGVWTPRGGHHHRPGDHDLGPAGVDGEDRSEQERGGQLSGQDQDRLPDGGDPAAAAITGSCSASSTPRTGHGPDLRRGRAYAWSMAYYLKMAMPFVPGKQRSSPVRASRLDRAGRVPIIPCSLFRAGIAQW